MGSLILEEICQLLETYKGRDKILRTLCYATKLVGGFSSGNLSRGFLGFSKQMSATRATLRLLDDLPMLKYSLEYGFGGEEPDRLMSTLGVTSNFIDQIYYPIEKMSWLAEHRLINGINGDRWDTLSSLFWVISIYLSLVKTLRYITILQKHKSCPPPEVKISLEKLLLRQRFEMLTCFRLSLDLIHAINTLPKGYLWSSKLNNWQVGLIATLSSILGIYQIYGKRAL